MRFLPEFRYKIGDIIYLKGEDGKHFKGLIEDRTRGRSHPRQKMVCWYKIYSDYTWYQEDEVLGLYIHIKQPVLVTA